MAGINGMFNSMNVSLSAMQAQRRRMDVVAGNLANAESTRSAQGGPYQRQQVVFETVLNDAINPADGQNAGQGVAAVAVVPDRRPPIAVHMPGHPDADANGNVLMPDVRPAEEMADLISAARSYEANAVAMKISRGLFQRAIELGRG